MPTFYDSVAASSVPPGAQYAAGYVDGIYQSWYALAARVPPLTCLLSIATGPDTRADVLDVESGDAAPSQVPRWVADQSPRPTWRPIVYCQLSSWMAVRQACLGAPEPWYWIASWQTAPPVLVPEAWQTAGCVLWQYSNPGPYDLSLAAPGFPPIAPRRGAVVHRRLYA